MISNNEEVVFKPVLTVNDAEMLRSIRNDCRNFMTNDNSFITQEQQETWFNSLDLNDIKIYLMYIVDHGVAFYPIGFGYCKHVDNETYLTGGLIGNLRGRGYGKILFSHLLEEAKSYNTRITLEVLNTNTVAQKLYKSLGFVTYYQDDRIMKMEYKNDSAI